jgi:hypothetical protein
VGPSKLTITRGLIAGSVAGALAFTVPWLLLYLLRFLEWLGTDIDPSSDGAWLGSYFLTSIVGTSACVSFGTQARSSAWRDFLVVALVAILVLSLVSLVEGPRLKSEPPFGEMPSDLVWLTAPAVVTGMVLLAWRTLRGSRNRSGTTGELTREQH